MTKNLIKHLIYIRNKAKKRLYIIYKICNSKNGVNGVMQLSSKINVAVETNTMHLQVRRYAFTLKYNNKNSDTMFPQDNNHRKKRNNFIQKIIYFKFPVMLHS